jgi:3-mercaptopyruvate sulfurtransferase SseA
LNPDKTFKSADELQKIFGKNATEETVLSCQKGITACILEVALQSIGNK